VNNLLNNMNYGDHN